MKPFQCRVLFISSRPCIWVNCPYRCIALIDTGATVPVLNISLDEAYDNGIEVDTSSVIDLNGFGTGSRDCYKCIVPYWKFGKTEFINVKCLIVKEAVESIERLVIPASMFKDTAFAIDTVQKQLLIKYPDFYDFKRRLITTATQGGIVSLVQGDTAFRTITGDTSITVWKNNISLYDLDLENITLEETLDRLSDIKSSKDLIIEVHQSEFKDLESIKYFLMYK